MMPLLSLYITSHRLHSRKRGLLRLLLATRTLPLPPAHDAVLKLHHVRRQVRIAHGDHSDAHNELHCTCSDCQTRRDGGEGYASRDKQLDNGQTPAQSDGASTYLQTWARTRT